MTQMQGKSILTRLMSAVLILCLCACAPAQGRRSTSAALPEASSGAVSQGSDTSVSEASDSAEPRMETGTASDERISHPEEASASSEERGTDEEDVESPTVLLFASDYQHRDGWPDPPVTLDRILDAVYASGVRPENYVFCGDYTALSGKNNYNADPHDAIEEIRDICRDHDAQLDLDKMIFVQGNHDLLSDDISTSGLHDFGDYLVYVINTETEFPWGQGKYKRRKVVLQGAQRLRECMEQLIEKGEKRPIFLAGHVPLHFTGRTSPLQGTGDNLYAADLFRVVNESAEELNLVYLYGHNHSRGWESYLGGSCVFRSPGEELLVPVAKEGERVSSTYTLETLNFTYLNAGYVGYFSSGGGESTLTCTVCEIWKDRLVFSRFDEDGVHLLNALGTPNPAKDDRELIPSQYYGRVVESPFEVPLKERESVFKTAA